MAIISQNNGEDLIFKNGMYSPPLVKLHSKKHPLEFNLIHSVTVNCFNHPSFAAINKNTKKIASFAVTFQPQK